MRPEAASVGQVGDLFHIVHLTDDIEATERWYMDVFSPNQFLPRHYLPGEKRHASLLAFADCVIEPLAPDRDVYGWELTAAGRFYERAGRHWHSIAWYTSDAGLIAARCLQQGVRCYSMDGVIDTDTDLSKVTTVFTHPRDTGAQLQFTELKGSRYQALDPRLKADWDGMWWAETHPLGLVGLGHITIACTDLDATAAVYTDAFGAYELDRSESALTSSADVWLKLGAVVLQLSAAVNADSLLSEDLAKLGGGTHAVTYRVVDLEQAEKHLHAYGVRVIARDEHTVITDPATTGGVPMRWSTAGLS